ncbi:MAG: hypothetical protein ACYC61_19860 [Isosphaeraceae bacterium]
MKRSRRVLLILSVAVGLGAATGGALSAQETPAPKDDGLESLLEKLSEPSDRPGSDSEKPSGTDRTKGNADSKSGKASAGEKTGKPDASGQKPGHGQAGAKPGKADKAKAKSADSLNGEDQEVDDLLKKLGETTETPAPEERPRGGAGGKSDGPQPPAPGGKPGQPPDRSKLSGKDKEADQHLEELTGRKRRKKNDDGERTGPAGELIKQMRDIEQKLDKPDTGEGTREEQKKVVKRIDQLIEEVRRAGGSSMMRTVVRRVRRPGQQPGQQPEGKEGALARGAPLQKPTRPTSKHANVGGKDIWGHLPDELRQEIENQSNELPLSARQELIDRYYLSVGKGKLIREESP